MIKLDSDEKILKVVRKHWFVLFTESFFLLFFVLIPIFIFIAVMVIDIPYSIEFGGSGIALAVALLSVWLLFVWVTFFIIWTDYYLDILITTNKQIIDVEQRGLFSRELSTFRLDRIQDITAESNGIIQTFFNFGTIHIQTAGEGREFMMKGVPKPFEIKNFVANRHDEAMEQLKTVKIAEESLERLVKNRGEAEDEVEKNTVWSPKEF